MPVGPTNRRAFTILLCCFMLAIPTAGLGQEAGKAKRIGFLRVGSPPARFIEGFRQGLREFGLVEGQHYLIEFGLVQSSAQIPAAAAELVRRGVDVIVASGTPSVLPARDAAGQIPMVFVATLDPVATELVTSLARPGRNVTGMTSISGDLIAKRLELIREVIPDLTRSRDPGARIEPDFRSVCAGIPNCGRESGNRVTDRFRARSQGSRHDIHRGAAAERPSDRG